MNLLDYIKTRRDAYADQIESLQTSGDTYGVTYHIILATKAELDHLIQIGEKVPTYRKLLPKLDTVENLGKNSEYL